MSHNDDGMSEDIEDNEEDVVNHNKSRMKVLQKAVEQILLMDLGYKHATKNMINPQDKLTNTFNMLYWLWSKLKDYYPLELKSRADHMKSEIYL